MTMRCDVWSVLAFLFYLIMFNLLLTFTLKIFKIDRQTEFKLFIITTIFVFYQLLFDLAYHFSYEM